MIEQAIGDLGKCISLYVNHDTNEVSCHNEHWSRSRSGLDSSGRNYWKTILNVVDVKIAENRYKLVQRHKRTYNHLIKCLSGGCMPPRPPRLVLFRRTFSLNLSFIKSRIHPRNDVNLLSWAFEPSISQIISVLSKSFLFPIWTGQIFNQWRYEQTLWKRLTWNVMFQLSFSKLNNVISIHSHCSLQYFITDFARQIDL